VTRDESDGIGLSFVRDVDFELEFGVTRQRVQGEVRIAALEFPCTRGQAVSYRAYRLCAMRPWRWPPLLFPWQIFHSGATHLKTVARERLLC